MTVSGPKVKYLSFLPDKPHQGGDKSPGVEMCGGLRYINIYLSQDYLVTPAGGGDW